MFLAEQSDRRTKEVIRRMTPQQLEKTEAELRCMDPNEALDLLKTLMSDPEAGSTGDVPFIENADQPGRQDDWSE